MKYEIKKLTTNHFFIILLVCFVLNAFLCYISTPNLPVGKKEMDDYIALYENDYENFELQYKNYDFSETINNLLLPADAYCMKTIAEQARYISNYYKDLDTVIFQAKVNMSELDANTYMYRYQNQILNIYTRLSEQSLQVSQVRGWDFFLKYDIQNVISGIFILLTAILLFSIEDDSAMTYINRTCVRGRFKLSVNKILVILFSSVILVVLQTFITLLCIQSKIGLCGHELPIQIIPMFEFAPFCLPIWSFVILQTVFKIVGVFLFGLFAAVVIKITRTPIFSFIFSVLFLAAEYKIVPGETLQNTFGRYVNVYQLLCANDIFRRYASFNLFDYSADALIVILFLGFLCCALFLLAFFFLYRRVPGQKGRRLNTKNRFKADRRRLGIPAAYPFSEIKKLSAKKWTLLLAVGLIFLKCAYLSDSLSKIDDALYRNYMTQFEGSYSEEKNVEIQTIRFEIDDILLRKGQIANAYKAGEIDERTYRNFMEKYWDSYIMDHEFEKVEARNEYLKELQTEGKQGWFVYDTGYNYLFGGSADWFLCIFLMILTCWLFLDEDSAKMTQTIRTTYGGGKRFFFKKIVFALVIGIVSVFLFSAIDCIMISPYIPSSTLRAPAISLELFENVGSSITILQMYVICFAIKLLMFSILAVLFASLGVYLKRFVSMILFVLVVLLVPSVIAENVKVFQYLDITAFLSGSRAVVLSSEHNFLFGWGILGLQWIAYGILTGLFIFCSNKKWCNKS